MNGISERSTDALRLLLRSPRDADGWAQCSKPIMDQIVPLMPDDLVEKDEEAMRVRLTERGKVLADYL